MVKPMVPEGQVTHVWTSQASILNSFCSVQEPPNPEKEQPRIPFPKASENKIGDIPVVWPSCWHYISWHLNCQKLLSYVCLLSSLDTVRAKEIISISAWLVSCSHFNTDIHSLPLNPVPWCMKYYEVPGTMGFGSSAKSFKISFCLSEGNMSQGNWKNQLVTMQENSVAETKVKAFLFQLWDVWVNWIRPSTGISASFQVWATPWLVNTWRGVWGGSPLLTMKCNGSTI